MPPFTAADLAAQIAANETGVRELRAMVGHFGLATVAAYMRHVQDNAVESVRRVLEMLQDVSFSLEMRGDDEAAVRPGDAIVIETPGCRGYGAARRSRYLHPPSWPGRKRSPHGRSCRHPGFCKLFN